MAKKKTNNNRKPAAAAAEPATPPPRQPIPARRVNFSRSLRCQLSDAEIASRADRAAHRLADVVNLKEELKASTKHAKSRIEAVEAEVHELSGEVRTRSTYRMVDCETIYDYEAGRVSEVRCDTGEVLGGRLMTEAERQRELPFPEAGDNGQAEAADEAGAAAGQAEADTDGGDDDAEEEDGGF